MSKDGLGGLVLRPVSNGPGQRGDAGKPLSVVDEPVGMVSFADGVHTQIYPQERAHDDEGELVVEELGELGVLGEQKLSNSSKNIKVLSKSECQAKLC